MGHPPWPPFEVAKRKLLFAIFLLFLERLSATTWSMKNYFSCSRRRLVVKVGLNSARRSKLAERPEVRCRQSSTDRAPVRSAGRQQGTIPRLGIGRLGGSKLPLLGRGGLNRKFPSRDFLFYARVLGGG